MKISNTTAPILPISENIAKDVLSYRAKLDSFLNGQISPIAFKAYRVPMGVYEQRTAGKYMIRIRIGAGIVLPGQSRQIARLSKNFGNGILHITTRQDIQIHDVNIEDTSYVLEGLLEVGLSSRGGGGNTVRNITACSEAGVCPKEEFDVAGYAIATAEYLLQDKSSFNLPRKYKIVFSGCARDCAYASVADLGFFAHLKNNAKGFAVYAAGGLGSSPTVAIKIEDFIKAEQIFEVAESIKELFDRFGDRTNKHKARLRYVLAKFGQEEFIRLYRQQRQNLQTKGLPNAVPEIRDIGSLYPIPESFVNVRLRLKNGDIPADDLDKVANIATRYGQGLIRTTQLQDILITAVAKKNAEEVNSALKNFSSNYLNNSNKIVACAGASTCKLGLCLSRGLSDAISDKIINAKSDTVIKISGCPNSCGHHHIADIGLQGRAKRVNGKLMPFYDVFVGAKITEGNARLANKISTVPAKRIPDLLAETLNSENIETLITKYDDVSGELPDDYYYDWASERQFSLAGRGPGECSTGVMDIITSDINEAKEVIKRSPVNSENIYKTIVSTARSLLVIFGLEPKTDREIFDQFGKYLIAPIWVRPETKQLIDKALAWKVGNRKSIENLLAQAEELLCRIEELFASLDANLKFRAEPFAKTKTTKKDKIANQIIDLRGVACPLNFVKAKLELEKIEIGDIIEIFLDDGESVQNAPASFSQEGQDVLDITNIGNYFSVKIRRKK